VGNTSRVIATTADLFWSEKAWDFWDTDLVYYCSSYGRIVTVGKSVLVINTLLLALFLNTMIKAHSLTLTAGGGEASLAFLGSSLRPTSKASLLDSTTRVFSILASCSAFLRISCRTKSKPLKKKLKWSLLIEKTDTTKKLEIKSDLLVTGFEISGAGGGTPSKFEFCPAKCWSRGHPRPNTPYFQGSKLRSHLEIPLVFSKTLVNLYLAKYSVALEYLL